MISAKCAVPAAALAVAALLGGAAAAAPTTGSCSPTEMKFIASDPTFFETKSTEFVNLPQAAINFTQGGNRSSCVIVSVSAASFAAARTPGTPTPMTVRVMLDDETPGLPGQVDFSDGGDGGNQVRSFDFIFTEVAPGKHTMHVQFKADPGAVATDFNRHNIIVQFAP